MRDLDDYDPREAEADRWYDQRADREADQHQMQQARYLETVLHRCSEERTGQDAVEWAIVTGLVTLTGHLETDLRAVMGEQGENYSRIMIAYQSHLSAENMATLIQAALPIT
jgi:hypothetical protein